MSDRSSDPDIATDSAERAFPGRLARAGWRALALACVALGSAGAVLPLVPTTPFLLVAAFAASRSSPRLHAWLYDHPRFGPPLRDWRDHRALRPRAKGIALALILASWVVTLVTVDSAAVRAVVTVILLGVSLFLATRPHGPDRGAGR